jgi:uncharacterized protein YkwD
VHAWHRIFRLLAGTLVAIAAALAQGLSPLSPAAVVHADGTFDSAMLSLLNQDRASHGLAPLQSSAALGGLAETSTYGGCGFTIAGRAEDMLQRNYFSHTILGCGSQTVFNVMRADAIAFNGAAENIGYASGISNPAAAAQWVNNQFMQSPEHAGNILDPSYNTIGIGSWWTSAGQTWSGTGTRMSDAVVVSTVFINAPNPPATVATYHAPRPAAPAPRPAPAVQASYVPAAVQPVRVTVLPPTPAPTPSQDDHAPLGPPAHVVFQMLNSRVTASAGRSPAELRAGMTTAGAAVLLAALAPLPRRLRRWRLRANG